MKNLIMLIIFLLASSRSISQIDTAAVKLNDPTARNVIKDLIRGDACQEELKQTRYTLQLTEKKADVQRKIILNLEEQESKSDEIILLKDQQIESQTKIIKKTETMLKHQTSVSWIYKAGTVVGIITSGFLLLR